MDGGYEDEGEDVVVRVQKRGKSWKEVGQNALKKKAHLQMMRKRRREDYDDVDEGRRPVKKTILPAMKQMGRKFDETGVAKGKPPAKQKAIRGNNRRMFVRVPIPKHPMSRGEYAKFHGVVVATQRANCGRKQPSVICRTDAFSKIIAAFNESRRSCVRKMGFGGILDLKISKLPRQLCYWLMSRLDGGNSYLVGGDGHVLPITASHWEYVFGFQNSGLPVPVKESDLPPGTLKAMALKYGEKNTSTSKSTIIIAKSVKELAGPVDGEGKIKPLANQRDRASFMENFMIVLLGQILCPSTDGGNMSLKLLGAVSVAKNASLYNWCEFCHTWLLDYGDACQRKIDHQGYAAGTGGCVLFLLIFYLDHLCRHPVRWDEFPRIKAWTQEEVDEAKNRDRKASEDYGRITTVDVVYGDPHPLYGREGRRSPAVEVAEMVAQMTSSEWRRTLAQEVTEMVMGQLAPLLQDRRGVSRERGMRSYHATDHLTIDVDGVAMPLDKSVNKVLTELDADDDSDVELQPSDGGRVFVGPHGSVPVMNPLDPVSHGDVPLVHTAVSHGDVPLVHTADDVGVVATEPETSKHLVDQTHQHGQVQSGDGPPSDGMSSEKVGQLGVVEDKEDDEDNGEENVEEPEEQDGGVKDGGPNNRDDDDDEGPANGPVQGTVAASPLENIAQENPSEDKNSEENTSQDNPTEGKTTDENLQTDDQERPREKLILRIPRTNPKTRNRQTRVRMTKLESDVVAYVESYNPKGKEQGAMLIECDGNDANQMMCYSVVRPREYVHSQYVRAVANIYNREWALEYPTNSRRIMLDSSFAYQKLKTRETYAGLLKKWSTPLQKIVSADISVIAAVEYVLHWRDTQYNAALVWKLKQMHTWPLDSISFPDYNDNHACGIVMLMAIQESARAFTKTMQVGDISIAREALFLSHLNSDFNSCRPLLPQIVATHCPVR
ncbi:uncharacterized protein [Spinacia oleracea]|uniref:Ubiquitin-like protease family profile domain-containing protein n=1 Tax=Spinacia oleracea TaxID=3562 RepID=A0ABM3RRS8_SPIOL|nr:uncharacterized protein LOC110801924 [Spinacia oleracea]